MKKSRVGKFKIILWIWIFPLFSALDFLIQKLAVGNSKIFLLFFTLFFYISWVKMRHLYWLEKNAENCNWLHHSLEICVFILAKSSSKKEPFRFLAVAAYRRQSNFSNIIVNVRPLYYAKLKKKLDFFIENALQGI